MIKLQVLNIRLNKKIKRKKKFLKKFKIEKNLNKY